MVEQKEKEERKEAVKRTNTERGKKALDERRVNGASPVIAPCRKYGMKTSSLPYAGRSVLLPAVGEGQND